LYGLRRPLSIEIAGRELQPHPPRPSLSALAEREGDGRALLLTAGSTTGVLCHFVQLPQRERFARDVNPCPT
jgi:hypothetical protein